jgi:hypothetical protein
MSSKVSSLPKRESKGQREKERATMLGTNKNRRYKGEIPKQI